MADLNNLGATPNSWDVDFDQLPMGFGAQFAQIPQPGTFKFQLPGRDQIEASFEIFSHDQQGNRLRCVFRDASALQNLTLKESYSTSLSNVTRTIQPKKAGSKPFNVSDLASLLKAVGSIPVNGTIEAYKDAILNAADSVFLADHVLTASCSKFKDRYAYDENLGKYALQVGVKGCGARYKQEPWDGGGDVTKRVLAIPRDADGKFMLRFECGNCAAEIRSWGQLNGFRPVK